MLNTQQLTKIHRFVCYANHFQAIIIIYAIIIIVNVVKIMFMYPVYFSLTVDHNIQVDNVIIRAKTINSLKGKFIVAYRLFYLKSLLYYFYLST